MDSGSVPDNQEDREVYLHDHRTESFIPGNSHTGVWMLIGMAPFWAPAAPFD